MLRISLLTLFTLWLLAAQVRYSLEQWDARGTFHFAPILLVPFSNGLESRTRSVDPVEVVSVNGRRMTGHSVYWQAVRHRTTAWDIRVKKNGREEKLEVFPERCTCGRISDQEILLYLVLPPAVALLAGLVAAWRRPREPAAWLILMLMVSLGQVTMFGKGISGFPQHFNPMAWTDAFRLPYLAWSGFAGAAWPAWLILLLCRWHQPSRWRWACWLVAPILVVAACRGLLAVGLAENTQAFAPLHKLLASTETARMMAMLAAVAAALLSMVKGAGRVAVVAIPLAAALLLHWPAPEIREMVVVNYLTGARPEPVMPAFHRTPEVVLGVATMALVALWLVAARAGWMDWAIAVSWAVPAVLHLRYLGGWRWWWWPDGATTAGLAMAGVDVLLVLVRCHRIGYGPMGRSTLLR